MGPLTRFKKRSRRSLSKGCDKLDRGCWDPNRVQGATPIPLPPATTFVQLGGQSPLASQVSVSSCHLQKRSPLPDDAGLSPDTKQVMRLVPLFSQQTN